MSDSYSSIGKLLRIGFLVNPYAGVGGPIANKGSDDESVKAMVDRGEIAKRSPIRAMQFLTSLKEKIPQDLLPTFVCAPGSMGASYLEQLPIKHELSTCDVGATSTAEDTKNQVMALQQQQIELLLFVGGDGTARDICSVVKDTLPVLGVPSGVKMHSGVFAISPEAAAIVLVGLLSGELTAIAAQDVRDIDEESFRLGIVKSRHYGEMLVPSENTYVQHVKQGGVELEELVLLDMAADIREKIEDIDEAVLVVFGPGSTTRGIQQALGMEATLLGIDLALFSEGEFQQLILSDASASELEEQLSGWQGQVRLVLTAIGGQGHIIGRGNQQVSPTVLRTIGKHNTWIVATKTKLHALESRPLIIDSSDSLLDREWQGLMRVICGYHDDLIYPLGIEESSSKDESVTMLVELIVDQALEKLKHNNATDSRRLFHGRGQLWSALNWCCIDYFHPCVVLTFFNHPPDKFEDQLAEQLWRQLGRRAKLEAILVQRRYEPTSPIDIKQGAMPPEWFARRKNQRLLISAEKQNLGFFLDIEPARQWLETQAPHKRVLNLFAFTCAFSLVALSVDAERVVNIDMSKSAIGIGRKNHRLNKIPDEKVAFLSHDIFKSWGKLKREGPFDIVIIDPPSYQKGSFVAEKDYAKVLRKMNDLVSADGAFLACLNSPEISCADFKSLIAREAPQFELEQRLANSPDFPDIDMERALKMLVYRRSVSA